MSVKPPRSPFPSGNKPSYHHHHNGFSSTSSSTNVSPSSAGGFEFPSQKFNRKSPSSLLGSLKSSTKSLSKSPKETPYSPSYFSVSMESSPTDAVVSVPQLTLPPLFTSSESPDNSSKIKKRPARLDLSSSQNAVKSGLRTPNSAKSAQSFAGAFSSSAPPINNPKFLSMHMRYRSPSMPVNALSGSAGPDLPSEIEPMSPQTLVRLMTSPGAMDTDQASSKSGSSGNSGANLPSPPSSNSSINSIDMMQTDSAPMSPTSLSSSIMSNVHIDKDVLIVDVRPYAQYAAGHIHQATSICIPSTLLKRPNFVLERFVDCMIPDQRHRLDNLDRYNEIILYDQATSSFPTSSGTSLLHMLLKFSKSPPISGKISYLRGGYSEFSSHYPFMVDKNGPYSSVSSLDEPTTRSSVESARSSATSQSSMTLSLPPVLTGFSLPETSTKDGPMAAFGSQIPTLLHYPRDTLPTMPIALPEGLTSEMVLNHFPKWLQEISSPTGPEILAKRFSDIEETEKIRLQGAFGRDQAFGTTIATNSSGHRDGIRYSISAGVELGAKNRYHNIFPYDHTRVVLDSPDSDYINASYISSVLSKRKYIATQGPLPDTFKDFWKMIWDQQIPVILMLTAESEGGLVKCHSYWGNSHIGKINVVQVCERTKPLSPGTGSSSNILIVIRRFELYHDDHPEKIRKVVQIQYTDWPDLGTAASPQDLISLSRLKEQYLNEFRITSKREPLALVHCSAGCGRTGTFCSVDTVLDILSKNPDKESDEDIVFQVVHEFRSQRLSMVQSLRQYILCYESILLWCFQTMVNNA